MEWQSAFWSRELAKKFVQYSSVGVISIPFGLAYALLTIAGWDHWLVAVAALTGGFWAARFVWGVIERRILVNPVKVIHPATLSGAAGEVMMLGYPWRDIPVGRVEELERESEVLQEAFPFDRSGLFNRHERESEITKQQGEVKPMLTIDYFTVVAERWFGISIPNEPRAITAGTTIMKLVPA